MHGQDRLAIAGELMQRFAADTGLSPASDAPRRYLWTDAFAVCNFIGLHRRTRQDRFMQLARDLVDQVHRTLGRHRLDEPGTGWIGGLDDKEGERHPTAGGLRIGKPLPERKAGEPDDARMEWQRDGQYFHYLTKWMHALCLMASASGDPRYAAWAAELGKAAYAGFSHAGGTRLYWKMSIDLSRPQVTAMGHHDPLDGFVTFRQVRHALSASGSGAACPEFARAIAALADMCGGADWLTGDPLGLSGLLFDAFRLLELSTTGGNGEDAARASELLHATRSGLVIYLAGHPLETGAAHRLAFRELGLAIGLHAVPEMRKAVAARGPSVLTHEVEAHLDHLEPAVPLSGAIEDFWLDTANRDTANWQEHEDINAVMLATSLLPAGFLSLGGEAEPDSGGIG